MSKCVQLFFFISTYDGRVLDVFLSGVVHFISSAVQIILPYRHIRTTKISYRGIPDVDNVIHVDDNRYLSWYLNAAQYCLTS